MLFVCQCLFYNKSYIDCLLKHILCYVSGRFWHIGSSYSVKIDESSCLCQALHSVCQIRWWVIGSWMIKRYKQQINLEKINLGLKFSELTIAVILVRFLLCYWYLLLTFWAAISCFTQFGGRFPTAWILTQLFRAPNDGFLLNVLKTLLGYPEYF